jgi:acetate kinase
MTPVLVINSGSSSLKYQLLDMDTEGVLATGLIERIGHEHGMLAHTVRGAADGAAFLDATYRDELPVADHDAAFAAMLDAFAKNGPQLDPAAVGHRVVHGGARFFAPTLITPLVEIIIDEL